MLVVKEWFAACRLSRDEVGEFVTPNWFPPGTDPIPSGAKARMILRSLCTG